MKILEKIKKIFKNQTKLPKKIEIKEDKKPVKNQEEHEDFEWLMHNKNDLTVEEVADIEELLEDEEDL